MPLTNDQSSLISWAVTMLASGGFGAALVKVIPFFRAPVKTLLEENRELTQKLIAVHTGVRVEIQAIHDKHEDKIENLTRLHITDIGKLESKMDNLEKEHLECLQARHNQQITITTHEAIINSLKQRLNHVEAKTNS